MSTLRRNLYRAARDLGDVEAVAKGPTAYGKRRARKVVYRKWNGLLRRLLRGA